MSKTPNFAASLLHKTAYGLDISGEVSDGGQQNLKDTRYTNTPPHPQQYTQAPEGMTLDPKTKLYHGTTMALWKGHTPVSLRLTTDLKAAQIEAKNAAETASYQDGQTEEPIVVVISFASLSGCELVPDTSQSEVREGSSWQESLRDVNGFLVSGDIAAIKPKFKLTKVSG